MRTKIIQQVDRVVARIERVLALASGLGLGVLVLFICADVIGRAIGWLSIPWTVEVSQYWLIAGTFLSAGWIYREMAHPRVPITDHIKRVRLRQTFTIIATVIAVTACVFGLFFAIEIVQLQIARGTHVGIFLRIPRWLVLISLPIGFALLLYEAIGGIIRRERLVQQ